MIHSLALVHPETEERHRSFFESLLVATGTGPIGWLQLIVMVAGMGAQVIWLSRNLTARINVAALSMQVKKLVAANNAERAVKLCKAANTPVTQLARIGVEARLRYADAHGSPEATAAAHDAMQAAFGDILNKARAGLAPTIAIGALASVESCSVLAKGMERLGEHFAVEFCWFPLALVSFTIINALRWSGWARELAQVREELGR